jgi:hypothetical protein
MSSKKGFISSLLDFSFSHFVSPRIVGIIYGLSIVGVILVLSGVIVAALFSAFHYGFFSGMIRLVGTVIISLLIAIVYLLSIRVGLEALVAGVITAQNSGEIKEMVRQIRNENA